MSFVLFSIILFCVLFLVLLFLLGIKFGGSSKAKWVFSIVGGLYALIPLIWMIFYEGGGDSPFIFFIPFLPHIITFFIAWLPFLLLNEILPRSYEYSLKIGAGILNLIIWAFIGYLIGASFKRAKSPSEKGASLVFWILLGILILVAGIYMLGRGIWR